VTFQGGVVRLDPRPAPNTCPWRWYAGTRVIGPCVPSGKSVRGLLPRPARPDVTVLRLSFARPLRAGHDQASRCRSRGSSPDSGAATAHPPEIRPSRDGDPVLDTPIGFWESCFLLATLTWATCSSSSVLFNMWLMKVARRFSARASHARRAPGQVHASHRLVLSGAGAPILYSE